MDIDNIIDEALQSGPVADQGPEKEAPQDLEDIPLHELIKHKYSDTEEGRRELYKRFYADIDYLINDYVVSCPDPQAEHGMYKCSLETWQAALKYIGLSYFYDKKLLKDSERIAAGGGTYYNIDLLNIGMDVYSDLCNKYRKQFFITDCCSFLGMSDDVIYTLSSKHADLLKKGHFKQEASMRSALASGRSNVTAMAILLNHDYDYTRTTQVIHTSAADKLTADRLPELIQDQQQQTQPQHIVVDVPESEFENM